MGRVSERKPLLACLISTTPTMDLIPIIYMAHSPFKQSPDFPFPPPFSY